MGVDADDYYGRMAARHRLIAIDGGRVGLCTFFVLTDELEISRFYDRRCWTTPPDAEDGSVVYVDKLFLYKPYRFTKALWHQLEQMFTSRVPSWQILTWYRPRSGQQSDRRYTYRRRINATDLHRATP